VFLHVNSPVEVYTSLFALSPLYFFIIYKIYFFDIIILNTHNSLNMQGIHIIIYSITLL
jgi:hypothetical protein